MAQWKTEYFATREQAEMRRTVLRDSDYLAWEIRESANQLPERRFYFEWWCP